MGCTRHVLNFQWEHHSWRRRVSLAENVPSLETNIWGRPVNRENVRCQKEEVCQVCGKIRRHESCFCEPAQAERCAIRLDWINDPRHATQ